MHKPDCKSESQKDTLEKHGKIPSWDEVNQALKDHETVVGYELVERRDYFSLFIDGSRRKKNLPMTFEHTPGKEYRQPSRKRSGALAAAEIGGLMADEDSYIREADVEEDSLYIEIGLGDRIFAYEDWNEVPKSPYLDESLENYPKGPESYDCQIEI